MFPQLQSKDSKPNLLGEDLLKYSDDEESPLQPGPLKLQSTSNGDATSLGETSRNSRESKVSNGYSYGSMQSPTSSLGNSDYDRSESDPLKKHARSMNRATVDALKDGGMLLTKEENKTVSLILLTVIVTCAFSMAFLTGSSESKNGDIGQQGNFNKIQSDVDYFPFPDGSKFKAGGGLSAARETSSYVPFKTVDRKDGDIPASEIVFPDLFHSSLRFTKTDSQTNETITQESNNMPLLKVPFPTGAFWTNLVIKPTTDREISYPVMSYPYAFKWNPSMMQISYPPLRRFTDATSIRDIFNPDMTIGTEENIIKRNVVHFDPLSVTLRFYGNQISPEKELHSTDPDPTSSYWESYLVQGSPYVTAKFNDMTPVFTPLSIFQNLSCPRDGNGDYKDDASDPTKYERNETSSNFFGICTKRETNAQHVTLHGVQFLVRTQENLTWLIFASDPITLVLDRSKRSIRSHESFTGIIRFALLPPPLERNSISKIGNQYKSFSLSESIGVKRLIYHAHSYPVGGKITWSFKDIPDSPSYQLLNRNNQNVVNTFQDTLLKGVTVGTLNFEYQIKSMHDDIHSRSSSTGQDESLLMLALPHHAQVLPFNSILRDFDLQYQCIKGPMTPIIGNKWSYDEHLTNIGFDSDQDVHNIQRLDPETKEFILDQVELDLGRVLPTLTENVYGFGKQVARLAQLCRIAAVLETPLSPRKHESDENDRTVYKPLTRKGTKLLHSYLTNFLDGINSDNLVYDINFGGLVTRNGILNKNEDFGNGWYNDHLFHYGYVLYASAILGRLNSTFVDEYGTHVDSIMYDIAHAGNSNSDDRGEAFFPFTRHKSWFDGHSFASGLFPFADGKSQESTSEAVNCYYGAYLWNSVRWNDPDDQDKINFAKLLLAMEIRGAKTYWHMLPLNDIDGMDSIHSVPLYNDEFEEGLMVGNLGMMDVTATTWFGTKELYVHMINFMPLTAITKELFGEDYVSKEFNEIISPIYDQVEMAWRGYTVADKAFVDPNGAWNDAIKLRSFELDSALSQSQVYYWISSMKDFNISAKPDITQSKNASDGSGNQPEKYASCDSHEGCIANGLTGLCCPTSDGVLLGCCN